jgi:transcriptional regulator with XRE-family HTH domain
MAKTKFDLSNLAEYRKSMSLNQHAFWGGLGVTQSGGSRYESGRGLPKPVAMLLTLRETGKITSKDLETAKAAITRAKARK